MLTGKFQMSIFLQNYTPSYKKNPWNSKHGPRALFDLCKIYDSWKKT